MLNTRDLEERWLKYKIKSYIPHTTIAVSSIIIVITLSIFFTSNEEKKINFQEETQTIKQIKKEVKPETKLVEVLPIVEVKTKTVKIEPKKISNAVIQTEIYNPLESRDDTSLKLTPSLDFMKKMQHSSLPYYQNETTTENELDNNPPLQTSQIIEEVQELGVEDSVQTQIVEEKPKQVSIKRRDAPDDIRHIIKRFKKNNNPALSLFVAKKYYELGEYHKAYNYALITNQIDRDIDASWIVFAKSLVKLNQKDMAVKTLKQYIESSHSSSAKILLDEIVSGKFK